MKRYTFCAHPSLALVKYWGKSSLAPNLPLTSSMAVTINRFTTTVSVSAQSTEQAERAVCDGSATPESLFAHRYRPFLAYCRRRFRCPGRFWEVRIDNDYPLAAGLASSSAIYAALTLAINASCGSPAAASTLSEIARHGSASAARAVFGGVVCLPARHTHAHRYLDSAHWLELRLIVAQCAAGQKPISSRAAMAHSKRTSPLFRQWQRHSGRWYRDARRAMMARDLNRLGESMQQSYLTMFATMHTARPPIFYWNEQSVAVIKQCQRLRERGVEAWETMDAGPQVKILTTAAQAPEVMSALRNHLAADKCIVSEIGAPPYAA